MKTNTTRLVGAISCAVVIGVCLGCSPARSASSEGAQPDRASASPSGQSQNAGPGAPDRFADIALVPKSGAYLGLYYGDRSVVATNKAIGRTPQIHLTYFGWKDGWAQDDSLTKDRRRGQISLVNWEPFGADFSDIVDGRYDSMLVKRAKQAGQLRQQVFVDFAAEMNEEEGWGDHDPALYVAAYRHVHDIFDRYDGGKVVWVWAPNNVDSEDAPAALEYYPGDAYVDWAGIDGYNWGTSDPDFEWQSFEDVFADMYAELSTLDKPIIIGETASAPKGGSKAGWIEAIPSTLRSDFPDVRAVVWFDVDKERDWRIQSSRRSLQAFRKLAASSQFAASIR